MSSTNNAEKQGKGCCGSCVSLAITAILIWLFQFKTSTPTLSIEQFDAFALEGVTNNTTRNNNTIHYDLKLKNKGSNVNKGIYYDTLDLTFYYKPNFNGVLIGNVSFAPFYQGHGKATHRVGDIVPRGVRWENHTVPAVFRLELATAVRYKSMFWKTKRHHLAMGVDLEVNEQGSLVKGKDNKGIKLISSKGEKNNKGRLEVVGLLSILIFIHSLYYLDNLHFLF
ncbi:protein NDR1-like [Chenopodium quinoa]|uniref:protein NDR1-like n=1 Tax=Chenopodium quinoa TaxID=63459 RepID=UPI000B77D678|nr:protein NDR1-like [Chenopodium quinoa]